MGKEPSRWTSDVWLAWGSEFYNGKPRFKCSICGSVFESPILTPTVCPNGHKAENDPKRIVITHKTAEGYAFPFTGSGEICLVDDFGAGVFED